MNYDANKLPLGPFQYLLVGCRSDFAIGKLSKATILRGFAALKVCQSPKKMRHLWKYFKELSEVLETPSKASQYGGLPNACEQLSSSYYSSVSPAP